MVYSSGVAKNRLSNEPARRISESPFPTGTARRNGIATICRKTTCGIRGLSLRVGLETMATQRPADDLVRKPNNSKDV